jgi:hypothetical protein
MGLVRSNLRVVVALLGTVCPGRTPSTIVPLFLLHEPSVEKYTLPASKILSIPSGVEEPINPLIVR